MRRSGVILVLMVAVASRFVAVADGSSDWECLNGAAQNCLHGASVTMTSGQDVPFWTAGPTPRPITIQENGTLTLDLNGHALKTFDVGVIVVGKGARLIVTDSKGGGRISCGADGTKNRSPIVVETGATLEFLGGTLDNGSVGVQSLTLADGATVKVGGSGEIGGIVPIYCSGAAVVEVDGAGRVCSGAENAEAISCNGAGRVTVCGSGLVRGSPAVKVETAGVTLEIAGCLVENTRTTEDEAGALVSVARAAEATLNLRGGFLRSAFRPFWVVGELTGLNIGPDVYFTCDASYLRDAFSVATFTDGATLDWNRAGEAVAGSVYTCRTSTAFARLKAAFERGEGTYRLDQNVEFPSTENGFVELAEGKALTLDLNGKSVYCHVDGAIRNAGTLEIANGSEKKGAFVCHMSFTQDECRPDADGKARNLALIENLPGGRLALSGGYVDSGFVSGTAASSTLGGGNVAIRAKGGRVTVDGGHASGFRAVQCQGDVEVAVTGAGSLSGHRFDAQNNGICLYFLTGVSTATVGSGGAMDCEGWLVFGDAHARGSSASLDGANVQSWGGSVGGVRIGGSYPFHLPDDISVTMVDTAYAYTGKVPWFDAGGVVYDVATIANAGAALRIGKGCTFEGIYGFQGRTAVLAEEFLFHVRVDYVSPNWTWVTVEDEHAPDFAFAPYFMDNMVLQRDKRGEVWGVGAKAGMEIEVRLTDADGKVVASSVIPAADVRAGAWRTTLAPGGACARPLKLSARCGATEIVRSNVLVGDVWLCGGQSNMRVLDYIAPSLVTDADATIRTCAATAVDYVPDGRGWRAGTYNWRTAPDAFAHHGADDSGVTVDGLSAMPYLFAKALRRKLGPSLPIGILNVARGGMPLAYYLTEAYASAHPDALRFARHEVLYYGVHEVGSCAAPLGALWDVSVRPMSGAAVKGCIWYQGEADGQCSQRADAGDPYFSPQADAGIFANAYGQMMLALSRQVRDTFGANLPFYFMQIASWPGVPSMNGLGQQGVRDGQQVAAGLIAEPSGMATVYDLVGVVTNAGHPANKQESGARLAAPVLREVYGFGDIEVPSGPRACRAWRDGNRVVVRFDTVGKGLVVGEIDADANSGPARATDAAEVGGFEFTADGITWLPAAVQVVGDAVVYAPPAGFSPAYVRYAYYDAPCEHSCNLYCLTERAPGSDAALLPAFPFNAIPVVDDPLPSNPQDVHAVLQKSVLDRFIGDAAAYGDFRAWVDGRNVDHRVALDEPAAFFSYATDQDGVVTLDRAANGIRATAVAVGSPMVVAAEIGNFSFGPHPQPTGVLRKIFGVTGAADDFVFSPQNVTLVKVGATAGENGLTFEIQPPAGGRQGFFYKATVDPSAYGE